MLGNSAKNGRLLITAITCAIDPSGIGFAAAALDGTIHAQDAWFKKHPTLAKLATELQTAFDAEIAKPRYNKPDGIRVLLPQMLEAALATPAAFAEQTLEPALILAEMKRQLRDTEHLRPENWTTFETAFLPLLTTACADPRLVAALQPALIRQQGRDNRTMQSMLQQVLDGQTASIALEDMIELAKGFEETTIKDRPALERFLTAKAQDYRALRAEVDAISDDMKRLANLKSAAQDAIARVDLAEVEALLMIVQTTELEEAAKTAELRADNALLSGDVDKAFLLLSTTADSFAAVDPLEPARRRILRYSAKFREHGLRYGGKGMAKSETLLKEILTDDLREKDDWLWAAGQNSVALSLVDQGARAEGEKSTDFFEKAVIAYHTALEVGTRAAHPAEWAATQNNLGVVLLEQGARTEGDKSADILAKAVTAFTSSLEVRTRVANPDGWASTLINLGATLQEQGTRADGQDGASILAKAILTYRSALEVHSRDSHPLEWAKTQNNLGIVLLVLSRRINSEEGVDFLMQAITAYRAALEVRTRDVRPLDWATTQNNLGIAVQSLGTRTSGKKGADLLAKAISIYFAALEVRTRHTLPVQWAATHENIAFAYCALAQHESCTDPTRDLNHALQAVDAALTVFDPDHMSINHVRATTLRTDILARLAS